MTDKRRLERYNLTVPVQIQVTGESGITGLEAFTKNVSSGGTFLTMENKLEVGQRVSLKLYLSINKLQEFFMMDNQARIEVNGMVIRKERDGVGIQFDKKYTILPYSDENKDLDS